MVISVTEQNRTVELREYPADTEKNGIYENGAKISSSFADSLKGKIRKGLFSTTEVLNPYMLEEAVDFTYELTSEQSAQCINFLLNNGWVTELEAYTPEYIDIFYSKENEYCRVLIYENLFIWYISEEDIVLNAEDYLKLEELTK